MRLNLVKTFGVLAIAALVNSGCGKSEAGPGQPSAGYPKLNGQEYKVLSGDIKTGENLAEGTGSLLFRMPVPREDNNYLLTFSLNEGSSVSLVALSDSALATGIEFILDRKSGSLRAFVKDGDAEPFNVTEDFPAIDAKGAVTVSIDVHEHGHFIVVHGGVQYPFEFNTRPKGKAWGLRLKNATVTGAKLDGPAAGE